jgi:transcriptional regulator GlxA family with amidase domain
VRRAAERARCVLAVGQGSLVLARAGLLAGERVPADARLVSRCKEVAPELEFDAALAQRRVGKFFLARDLPAAEQASLAVLAELVGRDRARRVAEELGFAFPPAEEEPK